MGLNQHHPPRGGLSCVEIKLEHPHGVVGNRDVLLAHSLGEPRVQRTKLGAQRVVVVRRSLVGASRPAESFNRGVESLRRGNAAQRLDHVCADVAAGDLHQRGSKLRAVESEGD